MTRLSGIAKRLVLPVLLAGALVAVQTVVALPPIPGFTFDPPQPIACEPITFTSTATDPEDEPMTIEWDFDYNGVAFAPDAATGSPVTHAYPDSGTRMVAQRVTAGTDPAVVSLPQAVTVGPNVPPTASISPRFSSVQVGQSVQFAANASDPRGGAITYAWDFDAEDDFEDTVSGPTASHLFTQPGSQSVRVQVTDNCGEPTVAEATVVVGNTGPTASFTVNGNPTDPGVPPVNPGIDVTFDASASTDPNNDTLTYEWDLNGDGTFSQAAEGEINNATVTKKYPLPRTLTVRLRVKDSHNASDLVATTLTVNRPPFAGFTLAPDPPLVNEAVTFRPTGSSDLENTISTYQWDLDGNGTWETPGAAPAPHVYRSAGTVSVGLRLTDEDGGVTVLRRPVAVQQNVRPVAEFKVSPRKPFVGDEVTFSSTSEDPDDRLVKQEWDFNKDGRYDAQGRVVSKTFKKGKHTVTLRVTDSRGAAATATQIVDVRSKPLRNPPDVQSSVSYMRRDWGIELVNFTVEVPSKTFVSVKCNGRGCPRGTYRKRSKKKKALLRFTKLKGNLRAGAKISIVFTRPAHITGWDTITIRGNKRRTVLRERCKPAGAKKPKRCPSS